MNRPPDIEMLVRGNVGLVRSVAADFRRRTPRQIVFDDLLSAGLDGLFGAARTFDVSFGVPFGAHARRRIRGAIEDWLRAQSPLRRVRMGHARRHARTVKTFYAAHGRPPGDVELHGLLAGPRQTTPTLKGLEAADGKAAPPSRPGRPSLEEREAFAWRLRGCTRQEQLTLTLFFVEGMNLVEIARALGYVPSHASRQMSDVLARMRAAPEGLPILPRPLRPPRKINARPHWTRPREQAA